MLKANTTKESKIIGDTACPSCREQGRDKTGNHLMIFEEGGGYCNRCPKTFTPEEVAEAIQQSPIRSIDTSPPEALSGPPEGAVTLEDRGITKEIASVYGALMDSEKHYYPRTWNGEVIGYKVRVCGTKEFYMHGSGKTNEFFGHHLIGSGGGKVFITEGELDAMSLAQALTEGMDEDKLASFGFPPVVSVPDGVDSAERLFTEHHALLNSYKQIILVPDNDAAGKVLIDIASRTLDMEKVRVAKLPLKDANDMLMAGQSTMLRIKVLSAGAPVPEKVVFADDVALEELMQPLKPGLMVPQYPGVSRKLHGFRYEKNGGELTVVVSGSGMGKSTFTKECMYSFRMDHDKTIGEIRLEETNVKTMQSFIAIDNNVPVAALRENPEIIPREAWQASYEKLYRGHRVAMLDHFGSLASETLVDHLKFLAYTAGCQFIGLDHISMVVSGQQGGNERKDIDILMTNLAAFVETSGVSVLAVVHLRRPGGDESFNEGAEISLAHLRGSAGLEQLSHNVIALEGSQREGDGNTRTARLLKGREWGDIGFAEDLRYYPQQGRLLGTQSEISV